MTILGIDQGSTKCGFALLEESKFLSVGHWKMKGKDRYDRYYDLFDNLDRTFNALRPNLVAIENIFAKRAGFSNPKTSIIMGETRGVIMGACIHNDINWVDVNPAELIKFLNINPRKVDKKQAAMDWITEYSGMKIDDPDGADAAVIAMIAKNEFDRLERVAAEKPPF